VSDRNESLCEGAAKLQRCPVTFIDSSMRHDNLAEYGFFRREHLERRVYLKARQTDRSWSGVAALTALWAQTTWLPVALKVSEPAPLPAARPPKALYDPQSPVPGLGGHGKKWAPAPNRLITGRILGS